MTRTQRPSAEALEAFGTVKVLVNQIQILQQELRGARRLAQAALALAGTAIGAAATVLVGGA